MALTPGVIGIIGFVILFVIILLNFPISFSFLLAGFLGLLYFSNFHAASIAVAGVAWKYGTDYSLMAVPLFILMGEFAAHSQIGGELFDSASKWFGKLPGGLAIATTWGSAGLAACTGSTTTGILTFGPIAYKPMIEKGYDKRLAIGTICCASTMGVMIPPSIGFILYATITEESTGRLFMAGVIPGLLQAIIYSTLIILLAKFAIFPGPPGAPSTWKEKFVSLKGLWGSLILFFLVIGGIYGGIFTPTEAAAIGAFGSFVILILRMGLKWAPIRNTLWEALRTTSMVYALVIGSMVFAQFITLSTLNAMLLKTITSWGFAPLAVIGLILVLYLVMGCIMPAMPMVVLTVPFLYPLVTKTYGYDGIWFGVLVVAMMEMAFVTPPIGVNLFVTKSLFREEIPMKDIMQGVIPFVISDFFRIALYVFVPAISLWLPTMMMGQG